MTEKIRLGIITDGTPVKEEVLASGMCRVNTRLFRALSEHIALIGTTNYRLFSLKDIAEDLQDKCILVTLPKSLGILFKIFGRFSPQLREQNVAFKFYLPKLVQQLHRSQVNWLFSPCGSDPSALGRAFHLAQVSGLRLAVYLVDDFLSGAILSGNKEHLHIAQQKLPHWLHKVDKIFVISEGLRDRLKNLYNVDSVVLPLLYELPKNITRQLPQVNKEQIIFVGSVSHFYTDPLKQLASVLDDINNQDNRNIILRLTLPNINDARKLIGDFKCLRCEPCSSSEELYQEIASSFLCFAPYSFDEEYKIMTSSSFPSKILDYLAAGKFILVYAPEYSSSVSYFRENELSDITTVSNPDILRSIIVKQLNERQDYSDKYKFILKSRHSHNYISNQVLNTILDNCMIA